MCVCVHVCFFTKSRGGYFLRWYHNRVWHLCNGSVRAAGGERGAGWQGVRCFMARFPHTKREAVSRGCVWGESVTKQESKCENKRGSDSILPLYGVIGRYKAASLPDIPLNHLVLPIKWRRAGTVMVMAALYRDHTHIIIIENVQLGTAITQYLSRRSLYAAVDSQIINRFPWKHEADLTSCIKSNVTVFKAGQCKRAHVRCCFISPWTLESSQLCLIVPILCVCENKYHGSLSQKSRIQKYMKI